MDEDLIENQEEESPFDDLHQVGPRVDREDAAGGVSGLNGGGHPGADLTSATPGFESTDRPGRNDPLVSPEALSAQQQPPADDGADEVPSVPLKEFKQLQEEKENLHNGLLRKQAEF